MSKSKPCVLAAVDLETSTGAVLEVAIGEAARRPHGELVVVYAHRFSPTDGPEQQRKSTDNILTELKGRAQQALEKFALDNKDSVSPSTEVNIVIGRPAREIVWAAAHFDAEVVVVGSHGRKGVGRLLVGSVSERVVRLAGCPVIVVREKRHDLRAVMPEIEPVCPDCAEVRASSDGAKLWCARHSEHHVRAHVYSSAGRVDSPAAWSSMTGS